MARPTRFERVTAWFVARYSIQLSYGRLVSAVFLQGKVSRLPKEAALY